jgi:hypothetical protein
MSRLAVITFLTPDQPGIDNSLPGGGGYPSQGLPGAPVYPSNGLPGAPVYPSQGLPGGGHISTLPVYPFDPTVPSNELPDGGGHPSTMPIVPGARFIVKWLACVGLILVPDNELPTAPVKPAQPIAPTPSPK